MKGIPLNTVIISGNLTDEPRFEKVGEKQFSKISFNIANNLFYSGKEHTSFLNVSAWNELAERLHTQLHKGTAVVVDGQLKTNSYTDRSGSRRKFTEISARRVYLLGGRPTQADADEAEASSHEEQPPFNDDDIPF